MNGKGITSMITGILSILFSWTGVFGIVLGILSIVFFGLVYKSKQKSGMAIAGLITGIIGLLLSLLYSIIWFIVTVGVASI